MEVLGKRPVRNTTVMRRHWRSFDIDVFVAELKRSRLVTDPPSDITELFNCYDATLSELLDRLAPLQPTKIRTRPSAPWFDAECHGIKAVTRRLEKAYKRKPSPQSEAEWRSQFSIQRALFQKKSVDYWSSAIDSCRGDTKSLWSKLRSLLQPDAENPSKLSANDHEQYFTAKIDHIRCSTAAAPPPIIEVRDVSESLSDFRPTTVEEVTSILKKSDEKQCSLDPAPTWLIKKSADVIAPVIASMCNALAVTTTRAQQESECTSTAEETESRPE